MKTTTIWAVCPMCGEKLGTDDMKEMCEDDLYTEYWVCSNCSCRFEIRYDGKDANERSE